MVVELAPRVDHEQVIREALAEHVGAVARDTVAGRVDGDPPFAPQWEVDDDGPVELIRHVLMLRARQPMQGAELAAAARPP